MKKELKNSADADQDEHPTYRVRLPGFVTDEEIGLGDLIERTASYLGIRPCGGCGQRAAALNRWLAFTNRPSK